ncbi:cytochrome C oxidase subunit I [Undibacterium cyanobacteriorum]|uniref:Cytochrome C oxidase subunit I n=1 Tax=Undibacterium cyanobacteriorum TaxID=3073561 RepID=A0ABY9RGK1_9BURK|nr:cytochrome C oxidase subunit I [Undibacterium sp. 20NA77.5]WMW80358.1 cytochrome C oxidase subunit I [Undibacterium sp. 20NA77.5]
MENTPNKQRSGRWKLLLIIAVCASPLIASYFTYYVIKPESRTNYGSLLDPRQFPMPQLAGKNLEGKSQELSDFKGKWIMLQIDRAACESACQKKLYDMRQLRTAQGKERERIERVWLITDEATPDVKLQEGIAGTRFLRVNQAALEKWLPVEAGTTVYDHIYLIDPLGNLMMRYPKDADPNKIKKDISKLLKASAIG